MFQNHLLIKCMIEEVQCMELHF